MWTNSEEHYQKEEEASVGMLGKRSGKLRSVFWGASTNSGAELGAVMSQTGLCSTFVFLLKAVEGPGSHCDGLLNGHQLFGATNRDLSHEDVAKRSICGCRGTVHCFTGSGIRAVEFGRVVA